MQVHQIELIVLHRNKNKFMDIYMDIIDEDIFSRFGSIGILSNFDLKELLKIRGTSKANKAHVDKILNRYYIKTYGVDKDISFNQKFMDLAIDFLRPTSATRLKLLQRVFPEIKGTDYVRIAQESDFKQPMIISLSMRDKLNRWVYGSFYETEDEAAYVLEALEGGLEWRGVFFFNPEWDFEKHEIKWSPETQTQTQTQRPLYITFTKLNNNEWFPIATRETPKAQQIREEVLSTTT